MKNETNKLNNEIAILKSIVKDQDIKISELEEQPIRIITKIKSYFDIPEDMKFLSNYCEDDVIISESDFMDFLDNLLKEMQYERNKKI